MLDLHSCQICYPLEIKLLLLVVVVVMEHYGMKLKIEVVIRVKFVLRIKFVIRVKLD